MELCFGDVQSFGVARVHDVDDSLGVWEVASPVGPYAGLSTKIPHLKLDVFVRHGFHVESDGYTWYVGPGSAIRVFFSLVFWRLFRRTVPFHSLGMVDTTSPTCSRSARVPASRVSLGPFHDHDLCVCVWFVPSRSFARRTEDGGLSCIVQSQHEDPRFAIAEQRIQLRQPKSHGDVRNDDGTARLRGSTLQTSSTDPERSPQRNR